MGMATGKVTQTSMHPLTQRTVYHGPLVQLVETIVGVAHGGQVVCDSATFRAMSPVLHETAQRVPAEPNYNVMSDAKHRCLHSLFTSNTGSFMRFLTSNMYVPCCFDKQHGCLHWRRTESKFFLDLLFNHNM